MVLPLVLLLAALPPASVKLDGFPFVQQKPDFCGEAVVEMALRRLGREVSQDQVFGLTGVDPAAGRGAWTNELAKSLRALGIEPGPVWTKVDPAKAEKQIAAQFDALHADLVAGLPSIVCMHYDASPATTEHFRLITGFDQKTDEVIYQEPAEADGANRRMKRADFLALWTFKPAKDRWSLIRMRIAPSGPAPEIAAEQPPTRADAAQAALELRKDLPGDFTVTWEAPFLVVGNEAPDKVRSRSKTIVKRTTELLLKDFFDQAPDHVETVWLFKDKASYETSSRKRFKIEPETPYGYYLSSRHSLVMNIRPGYGTLTHEMVHPFMHQAWPAAPGWLNEGVASLFEQPFERDGHLLGGVNWRLPGLKAALPAKGVPSFKKLTGLTTEQFYDDDTGTHYAASRYLCYWLQEKGLLTKVVKQAIDNRETDPTGFKALTDVLGKEPDQLRGEWEKFVMGLERKS